MLHKSHSRFGRVKENFDKRCTFIFILKDVIEQCSAVYDVTIIVKCILEVSK